MREYLLKHNFEKYFKQLCKKLSNKTIVVYGTGKLFQEINNNYDLKQLNIIGVSDRKYLPEDKKKQESGYNIIPYNELANIKVDCILIATQNYISIQKNLKKMFPTSEIMPLVKYNFKENFKNFINNISYLKKLEQSKSNTIVLVKTNGKKVYNPKIKNLQFNFTGSNNYVEINEPFNITETCKISGYQNNKIIIQTNNTYRNAFIIMGSNNNLLIGRNTTAEGFKAHLFSGENRTLKIGNDCQFAWDIMIRTTDAHTIYDINSKEIVNPAKDVTIGDHVWLTKGVTVLKGSTIPSNCIVGTNAIVSKQFMEENCIIAGTPAKVIKQDVNWDRRGVAYFK